MIDILDRITEYRMKRHWTEYQLAEKAGLPQSTISTWYRNKNILPSFNSLEKICNAFGITLSQFFAENNDYTMLTTEQKEILVEWNRMTKEQKERLLYFIKSM